MHWQSYRGDQPGSICLMQREISKVLKVEKTIRNHKRSAVILKRSDSFSCTGPPLRHVTGSQAENHSQKLLQVNRPLFMWLVSPYSLSKKANTLTCLPTTDVRDRFTMAEYRLSFTSGDTIGSAVYSTIPLYSTAAATLNSGLIVSFDTSSLSWK